MPPLLLTGATKGSDAARHSFSFPENAGTVRGLRFRPSRLKSDRPSRV